MFSNTKNENVHRKSKTILTFFIQSFPFESHINVVHKSVTTIHIKFIIEYVMLLFYQKNFQKQTNNLEFFS